MEPQKVHFPPWYLETYIFLKHYNVSDHSVFGDLMKRYSRICSFYRNLFSFSVSESSVVIN